MGDPTADGGKRVPNNIVHTIVDHHNEEIVVHTFQLNQPYSSAGGSQP